MRRYNYVGGKKKAKHRNNPETDPYKKLLALLNVFLTTSDFGTSIKWSGFSGKTPQQKYNAIKSAFSTVVTIENLGSNPDFLVLNSESYGPIPGIKTGHTFMLIKLNDGGFGTIGFFPEKYHNNVLSSLIFGSSGILASPDPIARNQIKSIDNFGEFKVVYDSKLTYEQTAKLSEYLASPLDTRKGISKYDTDLTYEPTGFGSSQNCFTFLQETLNLKLKDTTATVGFGSSIPIPNLQQYIRDPISIGDYIPIFK